MGATNFPNGVSIRKKLVSGPRDVVERVQSLRIGFADGTTEIDTGWDLPTNALVTDVMVDVITAEATGGTPSISFRWWGIKRINRHGCLNARF